MFEEVTIGECKLILGDCREILPTLPKVDLILTDPPYGIGLEYSESFKDTESDLVDLISWLMPLCLQNAKVISITPGNLNHYLYPKPTWTLCWFNRAGSGSGPWGFSCWQPIICYGPDPYIANGKGRRGDYIEWSEASEKNGHPCPKPTKFMQRWIDRVGFDAKTVIDPLMGSGTTGVACVNMGKHFTGIERERKYFDIACRRIEQAYAQPRLFEDAKVGADDTAVQGDLLTAN
jgi:DNA modification methylase